MIRIAVIILLLRLACANCFAQSTYKGLTPGQSRRVWNSQDRWHLFDRFSGAQHRQGRREKIRRLPKPLQIIEVKIGRGQLLSEQNDLAGVHGEVFDYMVDGIEHHYIAALNRTSLKK
ncbi:MAG: hypothetical protein QOJ64_3852 [Acidobacteriota bacterium]|nr:hypothetical protein [Acidobacteriota bacterium]